MVFRLGKILPIFLLILGGVLLFPFAVEAANPYIQNVTFAQDEGGDYISFDWIGIPNGGDFCSFDYVLVWFNRYNPFATTTGAFVPESAFGDFYNPRSGFGNDNYAMFGNIAFASGFTGTCSLRNPDLNTALPTRLKAYINPGLPPEQLSFGAEDFITVQLVVAPRFGTRYLAVHDEEQYFYQVPAHPLPVIPYDNVRWGFNEQDELTVSFDWVGPNRDRSSMYVGFNGTVTAPASTFFAPDPEKDITMNWEAEGNNNIFTVARLALETDFQKGQRYELPVLQAHVWTPSQGFLIGCFFRTCPVTRSQVESFMGRSFEPDDYITIAFTARRYTLNDPNRYLFRDETRVPVIIVPGIMGTELWRERIGPDDLIWIDINQAALPGRDSFLDVLALDDNGDTRVPIRVGSIFRGGPFGLRNYYGELVDFLEGNGYEEDKNLFTFPYDWRFDNNLVARLLNIKINEILGTASAKKVDIIAHSMGGLVMRSYVDQFGEEKINKIIYLGTPHIGAPKAFNALAFDDVLTNNFIRINGLNRETLHALALTFPSVFELLYQQPFVTSLNESKTLNLERTYSAEFLESTRYVDLADGFYQSIADPTQLPQFNIVGTGVPTLGALDFSAETSATGTLVREWTPHSTNGDGTVPRVSAESPQGSDVTTLYACGVEHDELANSEQVHSVILSVLEDQVVPNFPCRPIEHFVWYSGSPVSVTIRDGSGFVNGLDDEGNIRQEIPHSDFMVFEENEGGFLPARSSSYTFDIRGRGIGLFSFISNLLDSESGFISSITFEDIPVISKSRGVFELIADNLVTQMDLDIDGNGTVDFVVLPNRPLELSIYLRMIDQILLDLDLRDGLRISLRSKLEAALRTLRVGRSEPTANILRSFISEIRALSGKEVDATHAVALVEFIEHALELLRGSE